MRIDELPADFESKFWPLIVPYSIGLLRLDNENGVVKPQLIGSGTLVQFNNLFGILTAHHVYKCSAINSTRDSLGINLLDDNMEHRTIISAYNWEYKEIGFKDNYGRGPDIGVFLLRSQKDISFLSCKKSFWNLTNHSKDEIDSRPVVNADIWTVSGLVEELKHSIASERGFQSCISYEILRITSNISHEEIIEEHDYLHFDITSINKVPTSFRGWSGGGLWRIPLSVGDEGKINWHDPIFSGVAFYEIDDGVSRFIRCHGRRSICQVSRRVLEYL